MRPIALARVRMLGTGHNICGVSAQVFVPSRHATRGEQTQGVVDHITLLDDGVILFEREGRPSELLPLHSVGPMTPVDDLTAEILGADYLDERSRRAAEHQAENEREAAKRNAELVAHNTDAAVLRPGEPVIRFAEPEPAVVAEEPLWKKLGRKKPGPKPKGEPKA